MLIATDNRADEEPKTAQRRMLTRARASVSSVNAGTSRPRSSLSMSTKRRASAVSSIKSTSTTRTGIPVPKASKPTAIPRRSLAPIPQQGSRRPPRISALPQPRPTTIHPATKKRSVKASKTESVSSSSTYLSPPPTRRSRSSKLSAKSSGKRHAKASTTFEDLLLSPGGSMFDSGESPTLAEIAIELANIEDTPIKPRMPALASTKSVPRKSTLGSISSVGSTPKSRHTCDDTRRMTEQAALVDQLQREIASTQASLHATALQLAQTQDRLDRQQSDVREALSIRGHSAVTNWQGVADSTGKQISQRQLDLQTLKLLSANLTLWEQSVRRAMEA